MLSANRTLRYAFFAALLGTASPAHAWWDGAGCKFSADRKATLDTAGAERVEITARAGDLVVRPVAGTAITGQGRACVSREEYLAKTNVFARREGNTVRVWVEVPEEFKGIGIFHASLDLTVDVPAALPVSITDTSGDIKVDGLRVTRIVDSSGDIAASKLLADVEINDSSGDIRVEKAAGLVRVTDSSGDVVIHGARDVLIPSDSSGDIVITQVTGDVRIDSDSSGDITIADVGRNVQLLADSTGDVHVSGVKGTVQVP